jgi:NAD(P)-dependent dehydrogenase (short-subunit alcohol dehydrogenase family)
VHFAREGADVAILYLDEHKDADEVVELVKNEGRKCLKFSGDVSKPEVRLAPALVLCTVGVVLSMVVGVWWLPALEVCGMVPATFCG